MLELVYINRFDCLVRLARLREETRKTSAVRHADGLAAIALAKRHRLAGEAKRAMKT
jgi:hypothetical protein